MIIPHQEISVDIYRLHPLTVDLIGHINDKNTRYIDLQLTAESTPIEFESECTASVTYVTDGILIAQDVSCEIDENSSRLIIGFDSKVIEEARSGKMQIQPKVVDGEGNELTLQIPITVRISPDLAQISHISDDSLGSYAEVVQEIADARGGYDSLKERLKDTAAPSDEQVAEALEDYLDEHPIDFDGIRYVEVEGESTTAVDNCTDPDKVYHVFVESGIVTTGFLAVICTPAIGYGKAQYGYSKDGYIIRRIFNGSSWGLWDFIPTSSRVASMISEAIANLQAKIDSNNMLSSDFVDDTGKTNKFVTNTEKETWNGKYSKPSGGIPKNDLSAEVQAILDNADTAAQIDIFDCPADGSAQADFNAEDIDSDDIYDYLDALIQKYPNYISKEILGKESKGDFDVNRYVLFSGKYLAYEKENYSKMYAWKNGSTILYSVSVSPRIGDTMYSTQYVGTSTGTVSAVSNANETRTVSGTVYTRYKSGDVEPTLLYCSSVPDGYGKIPSIISSSLYNSSGTRVGSIATSTTDSQGRQVITYGDGSAGNFTRKPFYDTNSLTEKPNTIVIIANEHGPDYDPAEPAIICCRIMAKMCGTSGDEFIRFLRTCKVVFIPVANPWGFNVKKNGLESTYSPYMNYYGRNFHRNFDTPGWTYSGEGSRETEAHAIERNANYGGSEIETQYLMNTMYGATLGFAIHCMPTTEQSQGSMIIQSESIATDENFKSLCAELWSNYQMFLTHSTDCDPASYSKPSSYAIANCSEGGAMFEMNRRVRYTLPMHDSAILRADYQEMAGVIKIFAKRAGIWPESGYPDGDEVDW